MKKAVFKIISVIGVLLILSACGISDRTDTTEYVLTNGTTEGTAQTQYNYQSEKPQDISTTSAGVTVVPKSETESYGATAPETQAVTQKQDIPTPTMPQTTSAQTAGETYAKTGEMAFSDSPDNKYIKAVVQKYGVDAENLVALYTVPDNDGNIVLQFDGTKDENGKLIRNEDTLVSIFSVDKNLTSKCASENKSLNEYSTGEKIVMFLSVKNYIMPEFEEELKG